MEEWWKHPLVVADILEQKLAGLPVMRSKTPTLDDQIHQTLRLLRATATKSYGQISMLAVLDLLLAVDYFLVLRDEHRDSEEDGYDDDAERFLAVFKKHEREFEKFQLWFITQQQ